MAQVGAPALAAEVTNPDLRLCAPTFPGSPPLARTALCTARATARSEQRWGRIRPARSTVRKSGPSEMEAASIQTVLILKAPSGLQPWLASWDPGASGPTLTDQFGDSYHTSTGVPEYQTAGEVALSFPPLTDHAISAGGSLQLTLRIPEMYTPHQATQGNPYGCPCVTLPGIAPGPKGGRNLVGAPMVSGPWTVTFTLTPDAGQPVALPAPVTSRGTTYTVTEVRESYPFLYIQWAVSGAAIAATPGAAPTPASLQWTRSFVVSPSGQTANVLQEGGQLVAPWKDAAFQALIRVSGPGTYKLLLGGPASDPAATFVFHMR